MTPKSHSIINTALRIATASAGELIGRAINVLLPLILITLHGPNELVDSFFLTLAIAFFFHGTLANALTNALIPSKNLNLPQLNPLPIAYISILSGIAASIAIYYSPTNFNTQLSTLASSASIFLICSAGLAATPSTAILYSQHRYFIPGFTWTLRAIPILIYYLHSNTASNIHWLLIGIAAADTTRLIILVISTQDKLTLRSNAERLTIPRAALSLVIASVIAGFTPIIARLIATQGPEGTISIFEAADRLYSAIASLASIGIGNVLLVYLTQLKSSQNPERQLRWIFSATVLWSAIWVAISLVIYQLLPHPLATDLAKEHDITVLQDTFLALSLGLPGFMLTGLLSRRMLVLNIAHHLIPLTAAGLILTTTLGVFLFGPHGTPGLGLALSISQYLVAALMFTAIWKTQKIAHSNSF